MAIPILRELFTSALGIRFGSETGPFVRSGAGSPEGVVTGPIGSIWMRTDGLANETLYTKESGAGNAGWVASTIVGGAAEYDYGMGIQVAAGNFVI